MALPLCCLEKLGFSEIWIDIIYRYISNNWYSMIVNGRRHGFFRSGRGLRQGDLLSLPLFVLSAELLSQMLNRLHNMYGYKSFYMNNYGLKINHLSFADDTILFCSGSKRSMEMVLDTLTSYEKSQVNSLTRIRVVLLWKQTQKLAILLGFRTTHACTINSFPLSIWDVLSSLEERRSLISLIASIKSSTNSGVAY